MNKLGSSDSVHGMVQRVGCWLEKPSLVLTQCAKMTTREEREAMRAQAEHMTPTCRSVWDV